MGRRIIERWESLPARRQLIIAAPVLVVVLFAGHEAFFPRLTWGRSLAYAVMWAVPMSLVVVHATQVEVARRRRSTQGEDGPAAPPSS